MRRGDIWFVDLNPSRGSEANKTRPCVIVSNNDANSAAVQHQQGTVVVVPVTSNVARVMDMHVLLPADEDTGLGVESKAQAEQLRAVSIDRISEHAGTVPASLMNEIDAAIKLHLALS